MKNPSNIIPIICECGDYLEFVPNAPIGRFVCHKCGQKYRFPEGVHHTEFLKCNDNWVAYGSRIILEEELGL